MIPDRIENAEWLVRPAVQTIFAVLGGAEGQTRAVGGAVRDGLIGRTREHADIDMATELLPVSVMQKAKAAGIDAYPTGIEHGTVTLRLEDTTVEVTTLRQDVVTDGRHAQVQFGTDWVADAERRDFTLNALYCHADGTLFDPLKGVGDLVNGRVRFIGDAARRIAEDGLRVYRFFRFSASHGGEQFDPEGLDACRDAAEEIDHIARERVGAEMMRMLALPRVAQTLGVMDKLGLLCIEPGAAAALLRYETLGGQTATARLALMGREGLERRQGEWRLSKAIMTHADHIAEAAQLLRQGDIGWAAYRFGEDAVEGLAVAAAEEAWPREQLAEIARDLGRLPVAPLPVSGADLEAKGMKPGPDMGAALAIMERAWVESEFSLGKAALLERIFH
ncbi:CCA tRNA nucleotidyltransferase [Devosia sp. XJ19-1]|uniref:CCA tRNA nucleotidyltransferase n=1 Tax=Devosia ureilytica TaxID=2952754 RepID=A0A9Q4ANN5_9HYPH|nr:CCA tRNA nucleotidyltransferase [Devosia ureilytica]MCP8887539.1 CCA tRNA nucleotidyltransferase [Devosia ureilytica]